MLKEHFIPCEHLEEADLVENFTRKGYKMKEFVGDDYTKKDGKKIPKVTQEGVQVKKIYKDFGTFFEMYHQFIEIGVLKSLSIQMQNAPLALHVITKGSIELKEDAFSHIITTVANDFKNCFVVLKKFADSGKFDLANIILKTNTIDCNHYRIVFTALPIDTRGSSYPELVKRWEKKCESIYDQFSIESIKVESRGPVLLYGSIDLTKGNFWEPIKEFSFKGSSIEFDEFNGVDYDEFSGGFAGILSGYSWGREAFDFDMRQMDRTKPSDAAPLNTNITYNLNMTLLRNIDFASDRYHQFQIFFDHISPHNQYTRGMFDNLDSLTLELKKVVAYCVSESKYYKYDNNSIVEFKLQDMKNIFFLHSDKKMSLEALIKLKQYDLVKERVAFLPYSGDIEPNPHIINLYRGLNATPVENNVLIQTYLNHLKTVWCNNDEVSYKFILQYFADMYQNPCNAQKCALILLGIQGVGKGFGIIPHGRILGITQYYTAIKTVESLTSKFNAQYLNKLLIQCDEVNAKTKHDMDQLKSIIADTEARQYEGKGTNAITANSYTRYIFTSNHSNCFLLEDGDRHFFVLECNDYLTEVSAMEYKKYFDILGNDYNNQDFLNALYHFFLNYDLSGYNGSRPPMTAAKHRLMKDNTPIFETFIDDIFSNLESHKDKFIVDKNGGIPTAKLSQAYADWKKTNDIKWEKKLITSNACTKFIKEFLFSKYETYSGTSNNNYVRKLSTFQ